MSDPSPPQNRSRPWRRIAVALGGIVVLIGVVGYLITLGQQARTEAELRALVDQLDVDDPHWRLADIEAQREAIPDTENSARVVTAVAAGLPSFWFAEQQFAEAAPLPNVLLDAPLAEVMKSELAAIPGSLPEARRLAELPRGRYHLDYAFNPLATKVEAQSASEVCRLLQIDAMSLAQQGDIDGALRSARAMINAGRASGDEPVFISQVVRSALMGSAGNVIERVLAQGEASERELVAVQRLLALEEQHPTLLIAARGERAAHYEMFDKMLAGKIRAAEIRREMGLREPSLAHQWLSARVSRRDQITDLRHMTAYVESTRLPAAAQAAEERRLDSEVGQPTASPLSRLLVPAMFPLGETTRRKTAVVRVLMTLVAVERFRLEHGKWPESLVDSKPRFLAEVPLDPFDGAPLRYAKTAEGVVVYSIGKDILDGGGKVWPRLAADEGYRLWDVNKRRQPARAAPGAIPP